MTKFLLSLHVLAAVLTVGPVTVAASMFPRTLRRVHAEPGDPDALSTLRTLHRICRVYATIGLAVPVFGFATASSLGVLRSPWLITAIVLTGIAAANLALLILPAQDAVLTAVTRALEPAAAAEANPDARPEAAPVAVPLPVPGPQAAAQLAMLTGVFNLLWATVTVLMIIRPGSTTGA
ncbi:hypothetical protein AB0M29_00800 [Streptomyces sp. NPDC051976]|uniref:hypothetical protein n=1 Tax=Streptomyces sp. NPDC051976 TaxID=3154947 RepID=UPI003429FC4E